MKELKVKICKTCGRKFGKDMRISNYQWSGQLYCSVECKPKKLKWNHYTRLYNKF